MQTIGGRGWRYRYLQCAALISAIGVAVAGVAAQPQSLSQVFEVRYQQLLQRVQKREFPPEVKDEAKAVWVALRKDIIALDAKVETLKLEVMSQQGALQEAALDELGQKVGERERRLMRGIQDLDRLAGREMPAIPLVPAVPAASISDETGAHGSRDKQGGSENTKKRTWDIEIEFAPEDLTKGGM